MSDASYTKKGLVTESLAIGYDSDLIKDIALKVMPGRIVTLIGPNGSGKSTLLKTITGQLKSRGGVIFLEGVDKDTLSVKDIATHISMVMTGGAKPELMTCREVVESGRYPYTGLLGRLSDEDRSVVSEAMELTETSELADALFTQISDGQRQRVMLARSIAQQPDILVLDEPTSYLDIKYKADILGKIVDLSRKKNIAVLMSIHEPEIAMRLSDTVVAIGDGRICRIGTPREVFEESFIRQLYKIEDTDIGILGSLPFYLPEKQSVSGADSGFAPGVIFVQGTMSNVGKSLIAAGLCRVFAQDGFKVAPFKSQNMALNSYVTDEGLEMGRAQVVQAECCNIAPKVCMNPVLLKPVSDCGSQVIVNGTPVGNMKAADYYEYKKSLVPVVKEAYEKLRAEYDIIVVEGAGSPAEINLKSDDIVNMGLAEMIDSPVLLVGDIDRGGVFAQLLGTLDLLESHERKRVAGLIINKFRGDVSLLKPGIKMLEERANTACLGVVPYSRLHLDDEDSLSERLYGKASGVFDIAVIRFLHISNFTDLDMFDQVPEVSIRYVSTPSEFENPDIVVLPGTKSTIADMKWLRKSHLADMICDHAATGGVVIGICGGYQMLGRKIEDPENIEGEREETGLELLPIDTVITGEKTRRAYSGAIGEASGVLSELTGTAVCGYEIHMGKSILYEQLPEFTTKESGYCRGNVYGTYVHGLFDKKECAAGIIGAVASSKGKTVDAGKIIDWKDYKEQQYDLLAGIIRENVDIDRIYDVMQVHPKAASKGSSND